MILKPAALLISLVGLVACGGQVKNDSTGGGGSTSDDDRGHSRGSNGAGPGDSVAPSAGPSIAVDALAIKLVKGVLGEYAPGGGCGLSSETITLDLTTHELTVVICEAPAVDGGPDAPNTLVTREQRTLSAAEIDQVQGLLAGYAETTPPPKSECGYDGTAYEIDVTTSAATKRYWDEAYNCNYPSDVTFMTPWLGSLFGQLDAL